MKFLGQFGRTDDAVIHGFLAVAQDNNVVDCARHVSGPEEVVNVN